jgi:hypothetical protein
VVLFSTVTSLAQFTSRVQKIAHRSVGKGIIFIQMIQPIFSFCASHELKQINIPEHWQMVHSEKSDKYQPDQLGVCWFKKMLPAKEIKKYFCNFEYMMAV